MPHNCTSYAALFYFQNMMKMDIKKELLDFLIWIDKSDKNNRVENGHLAALVADYMSNGYKNNADIAVVSRCANQIPTTWLDPLLTGEDKALTGKAGEWGCPDIENLLKAIKKQIIENVA